MIGSIESKVQHFGSFEKLTFDIIIFLGFTGWKLYKRKKEACGIEVRATSECNTAVQ